MHVAPLKTIPDELHQAAELALRDLQRPEYDPPQIMDSAATHLKNGSKEAIAIPVVISQTIGAHDFMQKCLILKISPGNKIEARLLERQPSGFSDEYDPCTSISPPILVDINQDRVDDLIFPVSYVNAERRRYYLTDVYLVNSNLEICHSPQASTMFLPSDDRAIDLGSAKKIAKEKAEELSKIECVTASR
ncbi:hypothetical protein [Vulcaniibacterium tengchongense]|uniref:hypothetical protein n=1 Tax=Vulcaniibacterium tengchongense TaxID=1273429 RepID=UPI0013156A73|nr:hypothetical protein [Vulcaniibacterium tengchongense]